MDSRLRVESGPGLWESPGVTPNLRTRRTLALGAVLLALAIALPRFLSHTP